jgi:hypothetical protein
MMMGDSSSPASENSIVERWSSSNMLRWETGSLELDLIYPIFYVRRGVGIPDRSFGKFRRNFVKFEVFDVQALNNMTLFQFH